MSSGGEGVRGLGWECILLRQRKERACGHPLTAGTGVGGWGEGQEKTRVHPLTAEIAEVGWGRRLTGKGSSKGVGWGCDLILEGKLVNDFLTLQMTNLTTTGPFSTAAVIKRNFDSRLHHTVLVAIFP